MKFVKTLTSGNILNFTPIENERQENAYINLSEKFIYSDDDGYNQLSYSHFDYPEKSYCSFLLQIE